VLLTLLTEIPLGRQSKRCWLRRVCAAADPQLPVSQRTTDIKG
jgi:hypothetical protein